MTTSKIAIQGVKILTSRGWIEEGTVLIEDEIFTSINQCEVPHGFKIVNGQGLQMLPGIIDLHGDAFERMICPRPGINIPLSIAMVENDRNLLASGITTFYCSITDSYEPGLRSRQTASHIIEFILGPGKEFLKSNHRIHIRHEEANVLGHDELCEWLHTGRIDILSINDHLPSTPEEKRWYRYLNSIKQRTSLSLEEITQLVMQVREKRHQGEEQIETLIKIAQERNIPLASHDDDTPEKVALSQKRGVAIAEFPANVELAAQCQAHGASVLMGAPNLVRGGSHLGLMSVVTSIKSQVIDCLCSDYHYPSLFYSPFKIAEEGLMSFEQAWSLVSSKPAAAARIGHRKGQITPGLDADFLLISPDLPVLSSIVSVYVLGKEVVHYPLKKS
ncbi:alpha-D-ribose 1-methylphosphonate 5-triphosphate diphosphatase [Cylindrospermopsis curvispora]|uniref:alpha-D-ribose 1-methylphosphonate 5-triphosphate diphosphatase n=1 Tax=Cylindrospermopsis curvispora TaxID=747548 RepID=UPI001F21A885|nr:alpha-D-ribose 1-methylphosphonate 5-triphosphate diphosphatase [Cylindrospermopsis curvispora]